MNPNIIIILQKLVSFIKRSVRQSGTPYKNAAFVPKKILADETPWIRFGSSKKEYEQWIPEVCGICCLKMVGDTFGLTNDLSLYELTMRCLKKGGFKIKEDGSIFGVFHYPLVQLAEELGLQGSIERHLLISDIPKYLAKNRFVILSIDLQKGTAFKGNHLIVIHRYLSQENTFLVHNCAFAIGKEGANIAISTQQLTLMSNQRGITLWK